VSFAPEAEGALAPREIELPLDGEQTARLMPCDVNCASRGEHGRTADGIQSTCERERCQSSGN
jgi:hypothetical protein